MLVVKTTLKESKGKGIGLFADENIKKGSVMWEENPLFYRIIPYYEFRKLGKIQQAFIKKHATEYPGESMFFLDIDDTRFTNHSDNPNIAWSKTKPIACATRDINKGEEIFCDYTALNPKDKLLKFIKKAK